MLVTVAFAVLNVLPSVCAHDAVPRSVERGVVSSPRQPAADIRVGRDLAYGGCFPFEIPAVARGTRYVFVDAEGARLRRLFVLQFEEFLPASKEIYRYDMTTAEDIGGHRFRQSTFAYNSAVDPSAAPDEGRLTTAFLVQRGYEVPNVLLASRFLTLGSDDRKSEMILFYLEPAAAGVTLSDLYSGEEPTAAWTALRKPLADRSRQAFTIAPPGAPR